MPPNRVVWKADAEKPMDQEWAELSTADHCAVVTHPGITDSRISRVSTPVAQGSYAYKVVLQDGDNCFNRRAELGQGNPTRSDMLDRLFNEGEERWISFQVQLGNGFPIDATTWQEVMQLKQLGAHGHPVMALHVVNNQWQIHRSTQYESQDWNKPAGFQGTLLLGPARIGTWTKFTWRVKFSPNPSVGFLQIYGDLGDGLGMRQLLPRLSMSTMKIDETNNQTIKSHARIGIYRDANIEGNAVAYFDGYTVATSRVAAEENAFQ